MKYDVVATIGKYDKDGKTKYITRNVGRILETKDGYKKLLLDSSFNPAGCERGEDGKVWLSLFEPKQKNSQTSYDDDMSDDIPF